MRHATRRVAALAATGVALAASVVGFAAPAAAMTYRTQISDRWAFVDADAQGAAGFTYTPTQAWQSVTLYVRGRTADGTWTDTTNYTFYVNG